jgi:hypothetical protein
MRFNRETGTMPLGNPLRIPASAQRTATVIFLHVRRSLVEIPGPPRPANTYTIQGLGQTNVAWYGMIQWMATRLPNVEWVLPQAYVLLNVPSLADLTCQLPQSH